MTTFVDFLPGSVPFQFQATLDGNPYTVIVTWNVFGQRWYVTVYDQSQTQILNTALIGSPVGLVLESLSFELTTGLVTAVTSLPHGFAIGATLELTVAGVSPSAYNGSFEVLVTGPSTITYPLAASPGGDATSPGAIFDNISLIAPLFTSTLVFRGANQQFEISP